jgi:hypothetical protein
VLEAPRRPRDGNDEHEVEEQLEGGRGAMGLVG